MPLYEYQCQQCGHRFEKIQSFSAPDEKACPNCGGPVERLISAPAIQFKGAGWYVNDYAGRNKAPSSGSADSGSKESGGKEASAASSDSSSKSDSGKSDGGSKSDSGSPSSNSGTSVAKPSSSSSSTSAGTSN